MKMLMVSWVTVAVLLTSMGDARLVFPPGSDMGYIVPDDIGPQKFEDDTNSLNDIVQEYDQPLLQRHEREVFDEVESALLRTVEERERLEERESVDDEEETVKVEPIGDWHGKWFPRAPKGLSEEMVIPADVPDSLKDDKHGIKMGAPHTSCDNGRLHLEVDWDSSPVNYTCFDHKKHHIRVEDLPSVERKEQVPWNYISKHHGGVVMLYDPCTEPLLVDRLRKLLTGCFRKHIITPYTLLTRERPLALLAWGHTLEMATVNDEEVKEFIKKRALHGPEGHLAKHGSYKTLLIKKAQYPPGSNDKDSNICPEPPQA
ncbi:Tumor protein p53-inducible protein 13-like [Homarus americanus]|uniref:Tumor protein p53-inducible protein 13-like n=1 Tax=Homarus americanus TaxID=6706 RepID=A0A8J5KI75_HOMAM|nr:Tumor protein p53-inducible protein 13-like [Homarus americanus]